jgi:hypothetical protein
MKMLAALIALLSLPAVGLAQDQQQMPSYAIRRVETIRGTITGFDGKYTLYVRDVKGYLDHVTLHDGTIINPTGLKLHEGIPVTISGHADGSTFAADQIDTPYQKTYALGYPYAYPYYGPYYPYPFWGPVGVRVGFGWGWGRWR